MEYLTELYPNLLLLCSSYLLVMGNIYILYSVIIPLPDKAINNGRFNNMWPFLLPCSLGFDANMYALDLLPWFFAIVRNSYSRRMNLPYLNALCICHPSSKQIPLQGCSTEQQCNMNTHLYAKPSNSSMPRGGKISCTKQEIKAEKEK